MTAHRYIVLLILVVSACSCGAPDEPPAFDFVRYRDLAADLQGKKLTLQTGGGPYRSGKVLPVYVSDEGGFELNKFVWVRMSAELRAASNEDVGTLAVVRYQNEYLSPGFPSLIRSAEVEIIDPKAKVVIYRTTLCRSSRSGNEGIIVRREEVNRNNAACDQMIAAFLRRLTTR